MTTRPDWSFVVTDSLEKVFTDGAPRPLDPDVPLSVFLGERASFQLAFLPPSMGEHGDLNGIHIEVDAGSAPFTTLRLVELVPATLLAFDGHDDDYLRDKPGLYPDLLTHCDDGLVRPTVGAWRSVWFDVCINESSDAGTRHVGLTVRGRDSGQLLFAGEVTITVIPHSLPPLDIVNTHWLHADSLANYYGVDVFSESHWSILEQFVAAAARMDVTSLLTPVWTPPLDTAVGGRRLPVQLVDIAEEDGQYRFGFGKLSRWLDMCRRHAIHTVEMAHLFTQWGATATPAIYVETAAGLEQRFGWHVESTAPAYRAFLECLIPALRNFLDQNWAGSVVYHLSDEPRASMLGTYGAARATVSDLLEGCLVVDALSDLEFARGGFVDIPVVATDAVHSFVAAGVDPLWVYYCVTQHRAVSNRFIGMHSLRNRVIGHQLFAYKIRGFLHWGFNFYNAQHSTHPIDPFRDTCADGAFPAGDAFIVYPGHDGEPLESIRYCVFAQAMADHRAMQLLRDLTDFETVRTLIDPDASLAFDSYSSDPSHYLMARERINQRIVLELSESRSDGAAD